MKDKYSMDPHQWSLSSHQEDGVSTGRKIIGKNDSYKRDTGSKWSRSSEKVARLQANVKVVLVEVRFGKYISWKNFVSEESSMKG